MRMTQITDSQSGTITRTYDLLDQLIQETTPQGAVSYAYDGRRPADKHDCSWPAPGRSYYGLGSKLKHAAKRRAASGSSSSCRRMRGSLGGGLEDGGLANRLQRPEQAASFSGHSDSIPTRN